MSGISRDCRETVTARMRRDMAFREEFLKEARACLTGTEPEVGRTMLKVYAEALGEIPAVEKVPSPRSPAGC